MSPTEERIPLDSIQPRHFKWSVDGKVATVTLDRPERKNPLTFESYRELADTFAALRRVEEIKVVVLTGAGGNFCSGGDVHEIIGPLVAMREARRMDQLLAFTRLTGELVRTMRACPQPIVAAIDGMCVGAGAIRMAWTAPGPTRARVFFLFTKIRPLGADMGLAPSCRASSGRGGRGVAVRRALPRSRRSRALALNRPSVKVCSARLSNRAERRRSDSRMARPSAPHQEWAMASTKRSRPRLRRGRSACRRRLRAGYRAAEAAGLRRRLARI